MNWIKVRLTDISSPKQWKQIPISELSKDGYFVYGANGIIGKYKEYNHEYPTLAITCRGATCGNLHITKPKSYITANAMSIDELDSNIDINFLYYALKIRGFNDVISGSAQPQITRESLKKVLIDIPDKLEDQIRISTILSKAEALIKQRKESIDLLDEYLISTFLEMFGDPVKNEKGWEKKKVEAIANILTGFAFKSENYSSNENDIKICGGLIVYPQFIDWSRANYWPVEKVAGLEKYWLNEGDIIMALDRPWISAGFKLAMIKKEDPKSLLIQRTLRIRCEEINQYYLYFLLFHKVFENHCKPTETTIPHISPKEVQNFKVSIPPIKLQNQFAQIVEKVEAIKVHYKNSLQELENLYGALSQKAFKGELELKEVGIQDHYSNSNKSLSTAIDFARSFSEQYNKLNKFAKLGTSFKNQIDVWSGLYNPIKNLPTIPKEIVEMQELVKKIQTNSTIANPAIDDALQLANKLNEEYHRFNDVSLLSKSFKKQIDNWNKAFEPIKNLNVLPREIIEFNRKVEMLQSSNLKIFLDEKKKQRKLTWGNISFKQIADIIKEAYSEYCFNNEMLINYMMDDHVIFPNYYSSDDLKKTPNLNESEDYKSFIFTALNGDNPYIKLEQFFFDGLDNSFLSNVRREDKDETKHTLDYSGIYFRITE